MELTGRALTQLAAGTLSLADLRAALADGWNQYGRDEHHVLSGLMPWEHEHYTRLLRREDRILLIGCGTGRDLIALRQDGYHVEGVDAAAEAITTARSMLDRLGLSTPLHTADIEAFVPPGRFDVFAFSWFCYSCIPQARSRVAILARLATHLEPGGRIVVSYLPAARHRRLPLLLIGLTSRVTRSDWRPEPGDRVWASAPRRRTVHYQHEFTEGEIEAEAMAAGLRVRFHRHAPEGVLVLTADGA